jgi:hypothetical protein
MAVEMHGDEETAPIRELGSAKGDFVVPDDFDAPLPDEVLMQFEQ